MKATSDLVRLAQAGASLKVPSTKATSDLIRIAQTGKNVIFDL